MTEIRCEDEALLKYVQLTSNFTQMWTNHSNLFFGVSRSQICKYTGFKTILKTPVERVQNGGKIKVMFNSIKVHLVPHFSIILLHSLKISLLNIHHAKVHARTRSISP